MKTIISGLFLAALSTTTAFAHITLETPQAPVGASYKAVFRVGHGCRGAATTGLRVQIPEGVISAKPMPKAGWTLKTVKGAYARSYDYYGTPTPDGVREIDWSGGELPDDFYEEFTLRVYLTPGLAPDTTLYFPVIQQCGAVSDAWIEIPTACQSEDDLALPAPGVKLLPAKEAGH